MLEDILSIHEAGDLDTAETRYREWLQSHPDDAEALHRLATLRRERDDLVDAVDLSLRATALAPDNARYHLTLGDLYRRSHQLPLARQALDTALRLDDSLFGAALGIAQIAIVQGDLAAAREALDKADRLAPGHPHLLAQKGVLAQARGDHEGAVKALLAAAEGDPDNATIQASLGLSFAAQNQTAFAEQAFRNAIALHPAHHGARIALGQLLLLNKRPQEALQEFEAVLAQQPDHAHALVGRADILRQSGDIAGAVDAYRSAHAIDPNLRGLDVSLVQTLLASGAEAAAREHLANAVARQPRDPNLRQMQLTLASRDGNDAYRQAILSWIDADPDSLIARGHLATHMELRAEYAQAQTVAREALARDSRADFMRLILARAALREGKPEQAQEQLNLLPVAGLAPARRAERARLRGLVRDALDDHQGALDAWLDANRQQPGVGSLGTPPAADDIVAIDASNDTGQAPVFLLGLPGAGSESLAALLGQLDVRVLDDRFGRSPRGDAMNTGEYRPMAVQAITDPAVIDSFGNGYTQSLATIGETVRADLVDWLPFPDLRAIELLNAAFPAARWLLVRRDPRDCLLNWLALGCRQHLAATDPAAMGAWLASAARHIAAIEKRLAGARLLPIDSAELDDSDALAARLLAFLELPGRERRDSFNVRLGRGGLPTSLPEQRWQAYAQVLAPAFAALS